VLQNKEDNFWGWRNSKGWIEWRNGYTSRLVEDVCKKTTKSIFYDFDYFWEGSEDDSESEF